MEVVQVLAQSTDTQDGVVRQSRTLGENQVPYPGHVRYDTSDGGVGHQGETRKVEVTEMVEGSERGGGREREGTFDEGSIRFGEYLCGAVGHRLVGCLDVGRRRGEGGVADLEARLEGEFAEVVGRAEELEEGEGRDTGARYEVDFEEDGAVDGEEDDGRVGEQVNMSKFDLETRSGPTRMQRG
jgi:hypothetical protein